MKINHLVTIIAHPGQDTVILVGEDQVALAMTSTTALNLADELRRMAHVTADPPEPPLPFTLLQKAEKVN